MLKISISHSRKTSENFCSRQYGVALESEVADSTDPALLQAKIRELFDLAKRSVDEEVKASTPQQNGSVVVPPTPQATQPATVAPTSGPAPRIPGNGNGGGNGRTGTKSRNGLLTEAQRRAIAAICRDRGLVVEEVLADWNGDINRLTVKQASQVIDALKAQPSGNRARR